jgi:hypothetical protein
LQKLHQKDESGVAGGGGGVGDTGGGAGGGVMARNIPREWSFAKGVLYSVSLLTTVGKCLLNVPGTNIKILTFGAHLFSHVRENKVVEWVTLGSNRERP